MKFQEVFKEALRRRLHPNSNLRIDDLAYALGAHSVTIRSWYRGHNAPSGPMLAACISFFARNGDHAFTQELFPDAVEPLIQRRREREEAAEIGEAILRTVQRRMEAA